MIVDDLARESRWVRDFIKTRTGEQLAHIVQVPFPVYPWVEYDEEVKGPCLDWKEDRIPSNLLPYNKETDQLLAYAARAPFKRMVIVSANKEQGALFVEELPPDNRLVVAGNNSLRERNGMGLAMWSANPETPLPKAVKRIWLTSLIGKSPVPLLSVRTAMSTVLQRSDDPLDEVVGWTPMTPEMYRNITVSAIADVNGLDWNALRKQNLPVDSDDTMKTDAWHAQATVVTTYTMMNTSGIVLDPVEPPSRDRAARRRGDLPFYRYHVLKLKLRERLRDFDERDPATGEPVAWHKTRGHYALYTKERPAFGRPWNEGQTFQRFWIPEFVSGQADRIVEKDYEIEGDAA